MKTTLVILALVAVLLTGTACQLWGLMANDPYRPREVDEDTLRRAHANRGPAWSPDGTLIVFSGRQLVRDRSHEEGRLYDMGSLYAVAPDGSSLSRLHEGEEWYDIEAGISSFVHRTPSERASRLCRIFKSEL